MINFHVAAAKQDDAKPNKITRLLGNRTYSLTKLEGTWMDYIRTRMDKQLSVLTSECLNMVSLALR